MNLSEYRSKELIAQFGVPIPQGRFAQTAAEAEARARELSAKKYVVKAQIAAGGRGLAGGIKFAATPSQVSDEAGRLIGTKLVTEQTGKDGETIAGVYVEEAVDIADQAYASFVLDPKTGAPTLLASAKGGVAFEELARMDEGAVQSLELSADTANLSKFLEKLGLSKVDALASLLKKAKTAFLENDLLLLEINPLALTKSGDWLAVDAKITLDGNALFRHPALEGLSDGETMTANERAAHENEINFVKLDGNIGVVVNGAGLGLATNDMIIDAGGRPANFMDIRTTATSFQIAKGVELLLEDPQVKAILLNVHGGGMTVCDTVAEGVAFAYSRSDRKLPLVARLAGQNEDWARKILKDRMLPVESHPSISQAIAAVVAKSSGRAV